MKNALLAIVLALVVSFVVRADASRSTIAYLPIVASGTPSVRTALIYHCQCGAVNATLRADGTVILTIQDHSRGGAIVVGVDDGDTFHEFSTPMPQQRTSDPVPQFDFPGEKQGIGDTVEAWGKIITYAPNRTEPDGHYDIWRYVYEAQ